MSCDPYRNWSLKEIALNSPNECRIALFQEHAWSAECWNLRSLDFFCVCVISQSTCMCMFPLGSQFPWLLYCGTLVLFYSSVSTPLFSVLCGSQVFLWFSLVRPALPYRFPQPEIWTHLIRALSCIYTRPSHKQIRKRHWLNLFFIAMKGLGADWIFDFPILS